MKNNLVAPHINFSDIVIGDFGNQEKAFEYLCANFLMIYCGLNICPVPSNIDNFPGIESWPFNAEGKKCGYQSKFGEDAFEAGKGFYKTFKIIKEQVEKGTYELEKIFLFSKKDLSPRKKIYFDNAKKEFTNETGIEVEAFFGDQFLGRLSGDNKFANLRLAYFPIDKIKRKIYQDFSDEDNINQKEADTVVGKVENGFKGQYLEKDIKLAQHHQKGYTYKKLSYSTYPKILEIYNELEYNIADEIFPTLEYGDSFYSLTNFLQICDINLKNAKALSSHYKTEFDYMIGNIYGLFINYGTEGKSCLEYETSDKIHFKDKRHE